MHVRRIVSDVPKQDQYLFDRAQGFGHITFNYSHRRASQKNKVTTALAAAAAPIAPAAAGGLAGVLFAAQTPLWLLGLQCAGSAAAAICGAMVLSRVCAEAAEKAEAGEVSLSHLCNF